MSDEQTTPQDPTTQDPTTKYPQPPQPEQEQPAPGLAAEMQPRPDHGEESYVGHGRLEGRRAIVTGADSGIGRAAAIAFAREGADVVLSYLESEQADADEVITLVEKAGQRAIAVPGDLSTEAGNTTLVATGRRGARRHRHRGIGGRAPAVGRRHRRAVDRAVRPDVPDQRLWPLLALQGGPAAPGGRRQHHHHVLGAGLHPSPHLLDYAGTKAAINAFSKGLAQQVAERGIRVNVVAPGPVWTPLQVSGGQPTDALPTFGEQAPLGRAGQPAELAAAYVYLASEEASYTTGSTLSVTGGSPTP